MESKMSLSEDMREKARMAGLCDEWYNNWGENPNVDELLEKYKRGIDFVIDKGFPTDDDLVKNATHSELERNGLFVNVQKSIDAQNGVYVVCGCAVVNFKISGFQCVTIYVKGNARVNVKAEAGSRVFVRLYEGGIADMQAEHDAKCFLYKYSDKCGCKTQGEVVVRKRV